MLWTNVDAVVHVRLVAGMERRHFLMKAHVHLLELDSLIDTFPDACLVYTHR